MKELTVLEIRNARISTKGFRADDIYHDGGELALTREQIQEIPETKVYEWIKTGHWKQRHFFKWLKALRVIE